MAAAALLVRVRERLREHLSLRARRQARVQRSRLRSRSSRDRDHDAERARDVERRSRAGARVRCADHFAASDARESSGRSASFRRKGGIFGSAIEEGLEARVDEAAESPEAADGPPNRREARTARATTLVSKAPRL